MQKHNLEPTVYQRRCDIMVDLDTTLFGRHGPSGKLSGVFEKFWSYWIGSIHARIQKVLSEGVPTLILFSSDR